MFHILEKDDRKVSDLFSVNQVETLYIKNIFSNQLHACLDNLESIRQNESAIDYDRELMVAFWYSVHLERLSYVQHFIATNYYLKQLVAMALHK